MDDVGEPRHLPFNPATLDIVCRRDGGRWGTKHFNIAQRHVHHSPEGMAWGYGGSGAGDFALNILALFLPPAASVPEEERVGLDDGSAVSSAVWEHYRAFKWEVIAKLPEEGGTITGAAICAWLRMRGVEPVPAVLADPLLAA